MKEKWLIELLLFFFIVLSFSKIVDANTYLWENTTWEGNLEASMYTSQSWGDLDDNGFLDLVLIGIDANANTFSKIYTNNGTGLTENSTWSSNLTSVDYGSLMLGDIDNDGDLDLILTGCSNAATYTSSCNDNNEKSFVYTNNGSSFIENSTFKGDITDVWKSSIALGDIDNDGKLDLILTGRSTTISRLSKVYINNGSSFIENSTWQTDLTAIDSSAVVLGDIDNDNNLDLIISGKDSGNTKHTEVYINNGSSFARNTTWDTNLVAVGDSSLSLGDFDNDGDLDLTLIGCCDDHYTYNNTGSTFLTSETDTSSNGDLVGVFAGSISLGDYDNDGDLDMITTGREKQTTLYLGNNNGNFSSYLQDPESGVLNVKYSYVTWIDLENDSDLDLLLTGSDSNNYQALIYTNSISTANSKPEAPNSSFNATFDDGKLILEWGNGSDAETSVLGLYYNIRVGTSSGGNDIISGVYGGGDDNGYFGNMMQRKSISIKGLDASTDYYYSIQTIDTGLMKSSWSNEQHYTTEADIINPTIEYIFPANDYYSNKDYVHFGANVTDETDLDNVSLYGDWTGSTVINQTNATGNNGNHTFNVSLNDGTYHFYIQACDDTGNCAESTTRTFYVDTVFPNISLMSPLNASTWSSSSTVNFTYNVSDISIVNCSLIINDEIDQTDTSITVNVEQSFTKTLSNGDYTWSVNCTDMVNQLNNSETRTLTVDYTAPVSVSGSSSGKSGSSGPATPSTSAKAVHFYSNMNVGATEMKIKDKPERNVNKIIIHTNKFKNDVEFSVETINEKPLEISKPKKNVYKYLEINKKNIEDEDIDKAEIEFKVDKIWMNEQNALSEDVILNRFKNNIWNELPTSVLNEDNDFVYYKAISPGFSYFAVTVENKTVVEDVKEVVEEKKLEKKMENKEKKLKVWMWLLIMFLLLIIWCCYVKKKRK